MVLVCDQDTSNMGLAKKLGISPDKTWNIHPFNADWNVYSAYDFIHLFKILRNNMLDKILDFGNGLRVQKRL